MIFLVIAYLVGIVAFLYRIWNVKNRKDGVLLAVSLLLALILFTYEKANVPLMLSSVAVFGALVYTYGSKLNYIIALISIGYIFYGYYTGIAEYFIAQALLFGFTSSVYTIKNNNGNRNRKMIEYRRNTAQTLLGVLVVFLLVIAGRQGLMAVLILIILGMFMASYSMMNKYNPIPKALHMMERGKGTLGYGGVWLALGVLTAGSFLSTNMVISIVIALFISDSLSTVVGLNYRKHRLPYNKNKTIAGTMTYFTSAALLSFPFIGIVAIPVAIIGALMESLPIRIDDNFSVAVAITIFGIIARTL